MKKCFHCNEENKEYTKEFEKVMPIRSRKQYQYVRHHGLNRGVGRGVYGYKRYTSFSILTIIYAY